MVDGLKGKNKTNYNIQWGKWFTIGGILCAIIVYIVSAWVGLYPKLNVNGRGSNDQLYGNYWIVSQGFYNIKFSFNGTTDINGISLSIAGIVMIIFMALSVILPLIGYATAKNRLFYRSENGIFTWFLGFIIIMGILAAVAMFIGVPNANGKENATGGDIYRTIYFKNSNVNIDGYGLINKLWLKPTTNYWILFGITIAGAVAIITFGVLASKKMFFRGSEHRFATR